MGPHELLTRLISGIKMQLTYCSKGWVTEALLFSARRMVRLMALTFHGSAGMHFFFVHHWGQVALGGFVSLCDKRPPVPRDMHVWMREGCTEISPRRWRVYSLNNLPQTAKPVSRQKRRIVKVPCTRLFFAKTTCILFKICLCLCCLQLNLIWQWRARVVLVCTWIWQIEHWRGDMAHKQWKRRLFRWR